MEEKESSKITVFQLISLILAISGFVILAGLQLVNIWEQWKGQQMTMTLASSFISPVQDLETKLNNYIAQEEEKKKRRR